MTARYTISDDGKTLTVCIPVKFRQRSARKRVVAPESPAWAPAPARVDDTLVRVLARARRWQRMIDSGHHATLGELAKAEGVAKPYLCRVVRLSLLATDIVEAILDGKQSRGIALETLLKPFPVEWGRQRDWLREDSAVRAVNPFT
jgi:hypothetical protein